MGREARSAFGILAALLVLFSALHPPPLPLFLALVVLVDLL